MLNAAIISDTFLEANKKKNAVNELSDFSVHSYIEDGEYIKVGKMKWEGKVFNDTFKIMAIQNLKEFKIMKVIQILNVKN